MVKIEEYDEDVLHPIVLWAQRRETISIKVNVVDAKAPTIKLTETSISFQVQGNGAKGLNTYEFSLEFYKPIDREGCVYKVTPSYVDVQLTKQRKGGWWPRLIPENVKKPHFLKLDFDRWQSESEDEENVKDELTKMKESLKSSFEKNPKAAQTFVDAYLCCYNVLQFLLFSIITLWCLLGYVYQGDTFQANAYKLLGQLVIFAVLLSYMEAANAFFRLVRTPWLYPFVQVSGRTFAYFCLYLGGPSVQQGWAVWLLFLVWSIADIIRYPVYILQILENENKVLTWLRYHAWIILYPLGGFCEYTIVMNLAIQFEEYDMYSYTIPGISITMRLSSFLRVYVVCIAIGIVGMMHHMWRMRRSKYGGRRKFKPA